MSVLQSQLGVVKGKNYGFIGPQGCGKDTQCGILQNLGITKHVRMSGVFEYFLEHERSFLEEEADRMARGLLLSCDLTIKSLRVFLNDHFDLQEAESLALNGVPRTERQALKLVEALPDHRKGLETIVFLLQLPFSIAFKRCRHRAAEDRKKGKKRKDDTRIKTRRRLNTYYKLEPKIIDALKKKGIKVILIDASKSVDEVTADILLGMGYQQ